MPKNTADKTNGTATKIKKSDRFKILKTKYNKSNQTKNKSLRIIDSVNNINLKVK